MKNKINILLLLLFVITSCETLNPFEKDGDYIEKRIELTDVSSIHSKNIFKVTLIEDEDEYLILKGGENIVSKVSVQVNNQDASIDHNHKNNFRNFDLIEAEFHVKGLEKITIDAPANYASIGKISGNRLDIDITSVSELVEMNLELDYKILDFHSFGTVAGGYEFTGECPTASYILNGIINIQASQLHSNDVKLVQNGIGEAHVWAENSLDVTIYSSGDMYYKGNPEISINRIQVNNQSPTAKVIQKN